MLLPSSDEIRYFQVVAREQNISRAAEIIGIQQSSLSAAMKRLEDTLKVQLFIRGRKGITLNDSGRLFLKKSQILLDQWSDLASTVSKTNEPGRGKFTIGCHPTVGVCLLPEVVAKLIGDSPGLELEIVTSYSRIVTEQVIDLKLDFALSVEPVKHPELKITRIRDTKIKLWGRKKMPVKNRKVLVYDPDMMELARFRRNIGPQISHFTRTLPVASLELVASMVQAGVGYGILPDIMTPTLGKGVIPCTELDTSISTAIYLIRRVDVMQSPAARFVEKNLITSLQG